MTSPRVSEFKSGHERSPAVFRQYVLVEKITSERGQRASELFRRIADKTEFERPAGRGEAFPMLISSQQLDQFTCSLS